MVGRRSLGPLIFLTAFSLAPYAQTNRPEIAWHFEAGG